MDNPERITYFAATDNRGKRTPFGIKQKDRSKHMYIIGKTGMGKSTLIENMVIQDMRNGEGVAILDPHGGTADKLLEYVPPERINDVVYFAPFDLDNPIAFNVMEDVGYDKRHLVTSGLMATFKKIWADAWSARMEYILTNTLLALLEYPGATLLGVNRMYTDKVYRKKVVDNIKDPVVKDFWVKEFAGYTDRFTQEATPAIQNKIGQFTSNPLIRNIIGQPKSSFDIRELMDQKKILIVNLSKGQVGEVNMRLLGSMITTRVFLAAMSRADLSGADIAKLPNFFFYVDEFQNFANETFAEILSEARKYKLNLIIANQYIKQLETKDDSTVKDAVFGNVGTTIAFRVGPFDAEVLETIFLPEFTKEDLVNLGFAQTYITLMIDGVGSRPFSAITIPPIEPPPRTFKKEVIASSKQQYGNVRSAVEIAIHEELGPTVVEAAAEPLKSKQPFSNRIPERPAFFTASVRPRTDESRFMNTSSIQPPPPVRQPVTMPHPPAVAHTPHPSPPRPASPQSVHTPSAQDLKTILRGIAEQTRKEDRSASVPKQSVLKNALREVLKTNVSSPASAQAPKASEGLPEVTRTSLLPSAPPLPKPTSPPLPEPQHAKAPYEVSEELLRKVLRGDDV